MEHKAHTPLHPHAKKQSPWMEIILQKLKCFTNKVNHLNLDVHVTTKIKPTRGSFKAYVWIARQTYCPVKVKIRVRFDTDIYLLDKILTGLFDSLKPHDYVDQNDISTEVYSSESSDCEKSPDVF